VLTDRLDKLVQVQARTDEHIQHTDERLGVLIRMMDEWIKKQP